MKWLIRACLLELIFLGMMKGDESVIEAERQQDPCVTFGKEKSFFW